MQPLIQTAIIALAGIAITGCVSSGAQFEPTKTGQIIIGATTKEEMLQLFGPPFIQTCGPDGNITMAWHYAHVGLFTAGMKLKHLTVLFNQDGRVEKFNLIDNTEDTARIGK